MNVIGGNNVNFFGLGDMIEVDIWIKYFMLEGVVGVSLILLYVDIELIFVWFFNVNFV